VKSREIATIVTQTTSKARVTWLYYLLELGSESASRPAHR